MILDFSYQIL